MRKVILPLLLVVVAIVLLPLSAAVAFTVSGCAGGDFGSACSLQELINGGSILTGGVRLDQFALPGNINEIGANLSLIEVRPIDETIATGITYFAGDTLSYVPGATSPPAVDLKLGFRVTGLGGVQISGDELEILARTFGTVGGNAFAFLFQTDCPSGFDAPTPCTAIPGGSPQAISEQRFPLDEALLGTGSFAPRSSFFVTLGIQLGADNGDAVSLSRFEQRFEVFESTPVPEPGSLMLLGSGGVGLLAALLRRRRSSHRPSLDRGENRW